MKVNNSALHNEQNTMIYRQLQFSYSPHFPHYFLMYELHCDF
jgi:hypothetical protein